MMTRKFRDRWCAGLRSGDYIQGSDFLCRIGVGGTARYCCLGVAAELECGEDAWTEYPGHPGVLAMRGRTGFFSMSGLSSYSRGCLIRMNDNGASFAEIADWIEQNVEVES